MENKQEVEPNKRKNYAKSKEYPALSLNETIDFIQTFKNYPLNKPLSYDFIAKAFHVSVNTKSIKYKISAARQFGLITVTSGAVSFTACVKDLLFPKDENVIQDIKKICFSQPTLYKGLIEAYDGKALPPQEQLSNILVSGYGITPVMASNAAECFLKSAVEAGVSEAGVLCMASSQTNVDQNSEEKIGSIEDSVPSGPVTIPRSRVGEQSKLEFPLGNDKYASLFFPKNLSQKEAELLKRTVSFMIDNLVESDNK